MASGCLVIPNKAILIKRMIQQRSMNVGHYNMPVIIDDLHARPCPDNDWHMLNE
jgi:hypothetical protein